MKKFLALICAVLFLFTAIGPVWADGSNTNTIEIKFKVGDKILKINGKDVEVPKPYSVNGTTLVPLRVITEAFGAELQYNKEDKSITIQYADVAVKLVIGSKDAIINGNKVAMLEAPVAQNGTTMVPLRFITENFGAEVKYDNNTKEITVLKELASDTSIKDYSLILTVTNKEKMGDSYYGWTMNKPKNLKIDYRSFNGRTNTFDSYDDVYSVDLDIYDLGDDTLDSLLAEKLDDVSEYTLLSQSVENKNGQQYVKVVYKDSESTYEDRIYIKDKNAFYLYLTVNESANYKNNTEAQSLLDSFMPSFDKNGKIEDLSDVNLAGFRTYSNKKLKWSVNVPAEWSDHKSVSKEHEVTFADTRESYKITSTYFDVSMYSKEEGLTLDKWIENKKNELTEEYNPEAVKLVSVEDAKINNTAAKKIVISTQYKTATVYQCFYYLLGENYKYILDYSMSAEDFNNYTKRSKLEMMAYTFKFTEPKTDDVGTLLDPNKVAVSNTTRKVENKDYKWSAQIPSSWTMTSDTDNKESVVYSSKRSAMGFSAEIIKDKTLAEYVNEYESMLKETEKEAILKNYKTETVTEKGMSIQKYTNAMYIDESVYKFVQYIFSKNGYVYSVSTYTDNIAASEKNMKMLDDIWQSFEVQ